MGRQEQRAKAGASRRLSAELAQKCSSSAPRVPASVREPRETQTGRSRARRRVERPRNRDRRCRGENSSIWRPGRSERLLGHPRARRRAQRPFARGFGATRASRAAARTLSRPRGAGFRPLRSVPGRCASPCSTIRPRGSRPSRARARPLGALEGRLAGPAAPSSSSRGSPRDRLDPHCA